MLDGLQHVLFDAGLMFRWIWQLLKVLFIAFFQPVNFFFNFIKNFYTTITSPITYADPISFLSQVNTILTALPLWSVLSLIAGAGFLFLIGFAIFHALTT